MKKALPVLIVVIVAVGLWFAVSSRIENESAPAPAPAKGQEAAGDKTTQPSAQNENGGDTGDVAIEGDEEEIEDPGAVDDRSAAERYQTADEALKAVKDGAADYNDLILDQFTEPGDNCTWCPAFYSSLRDLIHSPETKTDQRSYFAEILAISGRLDNVKTLVEAIGSAKNQEDADLYAEALELTVGKDDVVKYLGEQLNQQNDTLKEASVAAITNQGTKLAVEELYNHTLEKGDPDGYYSMGIGLGEVVPDEQAQPYLQELAMKQDAYSHLAVKALLNAGLDGVKMVMDVVSSAKNTEQVNDLLKGAKDHVSYDEEVVGYLKQVAESGKSPNAVKFAKDVLSDFEQAQNEADEDAMAPTIPEVPTGAPMSMMPSE